MVVRFLLTNDDGIDAPGLAALQRAIAQLDLGTATVVAPQVQHSGCGHQVTVERPLTVEERSAAAGIYALDGTPADCTRVAIAHLAPDFDWAIAGINAGGNLGADAYMSGTVAAVREAAFHGRPAIALSHYIRRPLEIDWDRAIAWTVALLPELLKRDRPDGWFWNVNFPHLLPTEPDPPWEFCAPSTDPLPVVYDRQGLTFHYGGRYGDRDRQPGTDVDVCFNGRIAITQVHL